MTCWTLLRSPDWEGRFDAAAAEYGPVKGLLHWLDQGRMYDVLDPAKADGVAWTLRHNLRRFEPEDYLIVNVPVAAVPLMGIAIGILIAERHIPRLKLLYHEPEEDRFKETHFDTNAQPDFGNAWPRRA